MALKSTFEHLNLTETEDLSTLDLKTLNSGHGGALTRPHRWRDFPFNIES